MHKRSLILFHGGWTRKYSSRFEWAEEVEVEKEERTERYIETFILAVLNSRETINRGICHGTKRSTKSREIFEHLRYIIIFSFYATILLLLYYCFLDSRLNKFMRLSIVYLKEIKAIVILFHLFLISSRLKKFFPWFFIYTLFYLFIYFYLEIFNSHQIF